MTKRKSSKPDEPKVEAEAPIASPGEVEAPQPVEDSPAKLAADLAALRQRCARFAEATAARATSRLNYCGCRRHIAELVEIGIRVDDAISMAIASVRLADRLCQAMGDEQARVQALDNRLLDLRIGDARDGEVPN